MPLFEPNTTETQSWRERDGANNYYEYVRADFSKRDISAVQMWSASKTNPSGDLFVVPLTTTGDRLGITFPRPELWINGVVNLLWYFSTDGTDTTAISLIASLDVISTGESSASSLLADTANMTPDAVADEIQEWTKTSAAVKQSDDLIGLSLERNTTSGVNGDVVHVYGVTLEYRPANNQ